MKLECISRLTRLAPLVVAACHLMMVTACSNPPAAKVLVYSPSEKICQLTGDKDLLRNIPTTPRTDQLFGLHGTDLGYPVDHKNGLILLFGDTAPSPPNGDESFPPDDSVGWITTRTPPTERECTDLWINHDTDAAGRAKPIAPTVFFPRIKQGGFNVPSGGVSEGGSLYAFFWTDHCNPPQHEDQRCLDPSLTDVGRGVLARSKDDGSSFDFITRMPNGFVYSTAVDATSIADLPATQKLGTYIFSVPEYRSSVPFLAYAPPGKLEDPSSWMFFVGIKRDENPTWVSRHSWETGKFLHAELFAGEDRDRCVGEFSITWNRSLKVWLLVYNCKLGKDGQSIVARTANAPWGPWSEATTILDPDDPSCQMLMQVNNHSCPADSDDLNMNGDLYAPFVLERYTTPERTFYPGRRRATIYWLVSTWRPYQVVVMRTTLQVDTPLTVYVERSRKIH